MSDPSAAAPVEGDERVAAVPVFPPSSPGPDGNVPQPLRPEVVSRLERWRSTLYDLFLESFAVVLGISVALGVGAWQAGRAEAARAEQARRSLVEEVQANRALVEVSRAYHDGLLDSLGGYLQREASPTPALFSKGFVHPAQLFTTAWSAAAATDALSLLDYADVLSLSRLYAAQQRYHESAQYSGTVIYGALYQEGPFGITQNYRRLIPLIQSSMYLEMGLLREYDAALEALGPAAAEKR